MSSISAQAASPDPRAMALPASSSSAAPSRWLNGLVFSGFTAAEAVPLAGRIQGLCGSLACRDVAAAELVQALPAGDELLVLPLRENAEKMVAFLYKLRQRGLTSPALLVIPGSVPGLNLPLERLGATDVVALARASEFELWRSLKMLMSLQRRELEISRLSGELQAAARELKRRHEEVGYLTYSLAAREIDDELFGDRVDEKARANVQKRIDRSERFGTPLTCFLIGIDDMDKIKQLCGASFAAFVLVQVAFRLKRALRGSDFLWRHGEDGFLLLTDTTSEQAISSLSGRLIAAVCSEALEEGEHTVSPSVSIGAARCRSEMASSSELIDAAVTALGTARIKGKGEFAFT